MIFLWLALVSGTAFGQGELTPPYECSPMGESPKVTLAPSCTATARSQIPGEASRLTDAFCQPLSLTSLSEAEADSLFRDFSSNQELPFRYLPDGCQARALKMAQALEGMGIRSAKIFVKGRYSFPNPHDPLWPVRWQYHVAPVVAVGPEAALWVLDPSLFSSPVPMKVFLDQLDSFPLSEFQEAWLTGPYHYEWNHRPLALSSFRAEDLDCMEKMLATGRSLQRWLR